MQPVDILHETRKSLADINTWCSTGPAGHGQDQTKCVLLKFVDVVEGAFGRNWPDYQEAKIGEQRIHQAVKLLFGESTTITSLNDGRLGFEKMPREERHALLLKVLDKAIELEEAAVSPLGEEGK